MKIGIIGTGNIGGTLARKLHEAGHDVKIANSRGVEGVRTFAETIGATPVDVRDAVKDVGVIILSIPFPAIESLPVDLFADVPDSVPVLDTGNYYPVMRDPNIADIDAGMVESVWVSRQLKRPVTKAFNNILAYSLAELGRTLGTSDRLAVAVAGDDELAKAIAFDVVNAVGFDPVDVGSLSESWRVQPSTPAYCCDFNTEDMRKAIAAAVPNSAQPKRDSLMQDYAKLGQGATHADMVALNRLLNAAG